MDIGISEYVETEKNLLMKLRYLPEEQVNEVIDFIDFLIIRHKSSHQDKMEANKQIGVSALQEIDSFAIETGISDLAHQHDHYLYGIPKK